VAVKVTPPGRRPPPVRPDPARIARLTALGELHDQWMAANADTAGFDPKGRPKKSDYNIHNADIDPDPAAGAEFAAAAAKIFTGGTEGV
jgi:hypothetical protein